MASTAELCDWWVDELEFLATAHGVVRRRHSLQTFTMRAPVRIRTFYGMRLRTGDVCVEPVTVRDFEE